jgi:NOL1/NOP2/fmu family ribosome biogenesis protein
MATEVVEALDIQPGDAVLETCAAPGAKSVHILEELQGHGVLYSFEVDRLRFGRLDLLTARTGFKNQKLFCEPFDRVQGLPTFEKILCDVPCSSESFYFKRQESRKDISDAEVLKIQRIQRAVVGRSLEFLKPGGVLVYATCTYNRLENEDNRDWILKTDSSLKLRYEVRRYPHRERVPGGYFAVFDKVGQSNDLSPNFQFNYRSEYHEAMSMESKLPIIDLTLKYAEKYLRGEAITGDFKTRGSVRLAWNGFAMGLGKSIEGRVNNLLPKGLRATR